MDLLALPVAGLAASEVLQTAIRVVKNAWPYTIELGDVRSITKSVLLDFKMKLPRLVLVIVGGGFPCQGMSALLAGRRGLDDPRSALFWELVRVWQLVVQVFGGPGGLRCESLAENVANGPHGDIACINRTLGIKPYLICAGGVSHVRRPRF